MRIFILLTTFFYSITFASFRGEIIDIKTNIPIENAKISDSNKTVLSEADGSFYIYTKEDTLHIKAYGYKPFSFITKEKINIIKLEPIKIKALYLSFWGASLKSKTFQRIIKIIRNTEINAVVVDVKSAYGNTVYKTSFEQANSYGAWYKRMIRDMSEFMQVLKDNNVYTIARIATFKDELQAINNLEYAVKDENGDLWRNFDNIAWVDPFDTRSHDYTISIAQDAAKLGFDEINFDFIRFPARKGLRYSKKNNEANRIKALDDFLNTAQKRLKKYGVFISVDTYGNICWVKGDMGLGQTIKSLAKHADYISPMLYPSGFAKGSFGFESPSDFPYAVIFRSLNRANKLIDSNRIRPWLQSFKDYAHNERFYAKEEIREQIDASNDTNTSGWMMWSPSSRYKQNHYKSIQIELVKE